MRWKDSPRAVLAALLFIHVLAHIDRNMLLGFSPQITRDLGLSNAQYGLLAGAVWVLSFGVMAVFMGTLADRFSRTRVMAVGIFIWSACTAASGAAQTFEQMAAARFLVASGEAALVPAAVSLLIELFGKEQRGTALGVFFMGIPLGLGLSFTLAGTLGASQGWRHTFYMLGMAGVVVALALLMFKDRRDGHGDDGTSEHGAPIAEQVRQVATVMRGNVTVVLMTIGFVLVHAVFVGLAFTQLWLVRERGFDAANIARQVGGLQIVFGLLGSVVGGVLSDRLAWRIPGGRAGFAVALTVLCGPLMVACRFAPAGSALFYVGLCAGFFLPLAAYGPVLTTIQAQVPAQMRSTVMGFLMMMINIVAIALGTAAAGVTSDRLVAAGSNSGLTAVLLTTDIIAIIAALFFALAARRPQVESEGDHSFVH